MKRFLIQIMAVASGLCSASASMEPGTPMVPLPPSAPSFLILPGSASGVNIGTPFPFQVVAGDLVLLKNGTSGTGSGNWSEVVQFENVSGPGGEHGVAVLHTMQNWTGFALGANVTYLADPDSERFTSYTPTTSVAKSLFSGGAGFQALDSAGNSGAGAVTYLVSREVVTAVPEPTTFIAAMLLLLPFTTCAVRMIRRRNMNLV